MRTDNSIASFWHAFAVMERAAKRLPGKTEPLAPAPLAAAGSAGDFTGYSIMEVAEYH